MRNMKLQQKMDIFFPLTEYLMEEKAMKEAKVTFMSVLKKNE